MVVRYFGGSKLGVGGLIQAYKTAAEDVLGHSVIIEEEIKIVWLLHHERSTHLFPRRTDVNWSYPHGAEFAVGYEGVSNFCEPQALNSFPLRVPLSREQTLSF